MEILDQFIQHCASHTFISFKREVGFWNRTHEPQDTITGQSLIWWLAQATKDHYIRKWNTNTYEVLKPFPTPHWPFDHKSDQTPKNTHPPQYEASTQWKKDCQKELLPICLHQNY